MKILVVDDDKLHQELIQRLVGSEHQLIEALDGAEAMQKLDQTDVAIVDERLPDTKGTELIRAMRRVGYRGGIIGSSDHGTDKIVADMILEAGADWYLSKGDGFGASLPAAIATAFELRKTLEACKGSVNE